MRKRHGSGYLVTAIAVTIGLVLTFTGQVQAQSNIQARVEAALRQAGLGDTRIAVHATDLTSGRTLVSIRADEPMIPASNLKLFTTAAALGTLGPDFMFKTTLAVTGERGDAGMTQLIIRGDGDPSFGDPKILEQRGLAVEDLLEAWVKAVREAGITRVERIYVDDRVFDQNRVHPTWPTDQLHNWYCAQVAGINFHTNCIDLYPAPTSTGHAPTIRLSPASPFLSVSNRAISGPNDTFWVHRRPESNDLVFHGRVAAHYNRPVSITLDDPAIYLGQLLADRLKRIGVRVGVVDRPEPDQRLPDGRLIHIVQTAMPLILARANKDSQNLYAEALFKRMGHRLTGEPGSWASGAAALRLFLHHRIGPAAASVVAADGSGLSRDNRITAKTMVDLLASIHRDPTLGKPFRDSLAVGAQDGTLRRRFQSGFQNAVLAKSGYINQVSTLSGYLVVTGDDDDDTPNAERVIAFSLLFNGFRPPTYAHRIREVQEQLVQMLDRAVAQPSSRLGG